MKVHKINPKAVHDEDKRIRAKADSRSGGSKKNDRELQFYDWKTDGEGGSNGVNFLRVLPPYCESRGPGLGIFKIVHTWSNLPGRPGVEKHKHLSRTWPERGVDDYVEAVLERAATEFPLSGEAIRKIWPKMSAWVNVIDCDHQELGPQICRFPQSLYDWFVSMLSEQLGLGVDITDPMAGVDIKITRSPSVAGWYSPRLMGTDTRSGFQALMTPLHEDEQTREAWLSNLWDLDQIFRFPKDEVLAKYRSAADAVYSYLERTYGAAGSGESEDPRPPVKTPPPERPPVRTQAVQRQAPARQSDVVAAVQSDLNDLKGAASAEQPTAKQEAPKEAPPRPVSPPAAPKAAPAATRPPPQAPAATPSQAPDGVPPCFSDHQDRTVACVRCAYEFECMDATKIERKPYAWPKAAQ